MLGGCALQQDIVILEERLIALENQNIALQRQVQEELNTLGSESQSKEKNLRSQYASLNVNLESYQQELRLLTGRIEEMDYAVKRKVGEVEDAARRLDEIGLTVARLEQRLDRLEQYLNMDAAAGAKPGAGTPAAKTESTNSASEKQLYDNAKQAYDNGQLDRARQGFQQLIQSYPDSSNADNAQFWIGESYYREKWYEKAILEYQTVIEKYPKGNKVPAAMLKQGLAFLQLGDKSNARLILKELEKKYPQSNEAKIATRKLTEF